MTRPGSPGGRRYRSVRARPAVWGIGRIGTSRLGGWLRAARPSAALCAYLDTYMNPFTIRATLMTAKRTEAIIGFAFRSPQNHRQSLARPLPKKYRSASTIEWRSRYSYTASAPMAKPPAMDRRPVSTSALCPAARGHPHNLWHAPHHHARERHRSLPGCAPDPGAPRTGTSASTSPWLSRRPCAAGSMPAVSTR
jgi:hypothetical protein